MASYDECIVSEVPILIRLNGNSPLFSELFTSDTTPLSVGVPIHFLLCTVPLPLIREKGHQPHNIYRGVEINADLCHTEWRNCHFRNWTETGQDLSFEYVYKFSPQPQRLWYSELTEGRLLSSSSVVPVAARTKVEYRREIVEQQERINFT